MKEEIFTFRRLFEYFSKNMVTHNSLMHLFLSSGRAFSRSDCSVIKSEWRAEICCTMPGADTYVDNPAWASKNFFFQEKKCWISSPFKI